MICLLSFASACIRTIRFLTQRYCARRLYIFLLKKLKPSLQSTQKKTTLTIHCFLPKKKRQFLRAQVPDALSRQVHSLRTSACSQKQHRLQTPSPDFGTSLATVMRRSGTAV